MDTFSIYSTFDLPCQYYFKNNHHDHNSINYIFSTIILIKISKTIIVIEFAFTDDFIPFSDSLPNDWNNRKDIYLVCFFKESIDKRNGI